MGGGTLQIAGNASSASSQSFSSTTLTAGMSVISVAPSSGSNNPTLTLNGITANLAGTVEYIGPASNTSASTAGGTSGTAEAALTSASPGAVTATGTITTTSQGNTGVVGVWTGPGSSAVATVGLYDWATTNLAGSGGSGSSPFTLIGGSQVTNFYTILNGTMAAGAKNYDVTGNSTSFPTTSLVTLCFNTAAAITMTSANGNWPLGGILVTPNVGAHNVNFVNAANASRGLNQNSGDNLSIFQNNTSGELLFNAGDYYNILGTGAYIQSGPGTVYLNSAVGNNYSGANYLNGGVTEIAAERQRTASIG